MKTKTLLSYLLVILALGNARAQDTIQGKQPAKMRKFQIGVSAGPAYNYRYIKNTGSFENSSIVDARNKMETFSIGYSFGLSGAYIFNRHFSLELGLQYSKKGFQEKYQDLIYAQSSPGSPAQLKFIYDFYYLDIPLKANYFVGSKRIRFVASLGLSPNVFIGENHRSVAKYADGRIEKKQQYVNSTYFNLFTLSSVASAGIDLTLNSRINLRVEPIFKYGFVALASTPIRDHLWSAGINISGYLSF